MDGQCAIRLGEVELRLLPEHAVWCSATATLMVADLHLGKEQAFRTAGIPVPDLLTEDLARLGRLLTQTASRQLYILGDLLHARTGSSLRLHETFVAWRNQHPSVAMTLIRGNHDRGTGDPPPDWELICLDAPVQWRSLALTHDPLCDGKTWNVAGHLHPKWRWRSRAETIKLPCFLLRQRSLVLPAFGRFIDHGVISQQPSDVIYVVAEGAVVSVGNGSRWVPGTA